MSTVTVDYFLRLKGRFGSSTAGALGVGVAAGASPNAGGAVPKSAAAGAEVCATGLYACCAAGGGVQVCCGCGTSGEGVIHCGCAGTLTSGAVPYPVIFPTRLPR